ncbi:hypothetical protein HN51_042398 [Arachis hypogaea]|uniref:probable carboxylesterase 2 n=1 Tax=Arachis hypogaea TaxID=3818 RepID=UPI000DEC4074|nr:probable carboxylesterase 2 [Arachis hypogaea]XP_025660403.1 probable carboxylesterase 2 [Arachis hypogaea]
MESSTNSTTITDEQPQIAQEFPHIIRVFTDGRVERLRGTDIVPPSLYPHSVVSSKDITLDSQNNIAARLFLPPPQSTHNHKLPIVIYFHGGAFCVNSPFNAAYHNYLTALVSKANVVAVSVQYRLAPEHPLPAAYDDAWTALQWVASHGKNNGPEPWLNEHADFERVFLAGDSAGANIVHNIVMMAGHPDMNLGIDILGACLSHPYFWGSTPIGSEVLELGKRELVDRLWPFICPSMPESDNLWVNPMAEDAPSLAWLGCRRVFVCIAEKDVLKDRGRLYYEALSRSGWTGVVEIEETEGKGHAFHIHDLECDKAKELITSMAEFFNRDAPPF